MILVTLAIDCSGAVFIYYLLDKIWAKDIDIASYLSEC